MVFSYAPTEREAEENSALSPFRRAHCDGVAISKNGTTSFASAGSNHEHRGRQGDVLVRLNERQLIGIPHPKAASPLPTRRGLLDRQPRRRQKTGSYLAAVR